MYRSASFARTLSQLKKTTSGPEALEAAAREAFEAACTPLPVPMRDELFAYAWDLMVSGERDEEVLGTLVDLVWEDYDDRNDPLESDDWLFLGDLIDAYAADMDVPRIQYIMERIVARGLLS